MRNIDQCTHQSARHTAITDDANGQGRCTTDCDHLDNSYTVRGRCQPLTRWRVTTATKLPTITAETHCGSDMHCETQGAGTAGSNACNWRHTTDVRWRCRRHGCTQTQFPLTKRGHTGRTHTCANVAFVGQVLQCEHGVGVSQLWGFWQFKKCKNWGGIVELDVGGSDNRHRGRAAILLAI